MDDSCVKFLAIPPSHVFSRNAGNDAFIKTKWCQIEKDVWAVTKLESGYTSGLNFMPSSPCLFQKMPGTPKFVRFYCQHGTQMRTIIRQFPKSNQFLRWLGYISMPNFRPPHWGVIWKYPQTTNWIGFTESKRCQNEENQQTVTIILLVLNVVRIHQHAKFQAVPYALLRKCPKYIGTDGRSIASSVIWTDGTKHGRTTLKHDTPARKGGSKKGTELESQWKIVREMDTWSRQVCFGLFSQI